MDKPKNKWWDVKKFDVGRELANPDYVRWADERIAALESDVAKFTSTNTGSPKCAECGRVLYDFDVDENKICIDCSSALRAGA